MYIHGSAIVFAVFAYFIYIPIFLYSLLITDFPIPVSIVGLFIGWLIYKAACAINIWNDVTNAMQTTNPLHETMKLGKAVRQAFKHRATWSGFKATTEEVCVQIEFEVDDKFMNYLAQAVVLRKENPAFRTSRVRNELKPQSPFSFQRFYDIQRKKDKVYFKMQLIAHANTHSTGWWSYSHGFDHGYIGLVNDNTQINDILTWEDIENYIYPQ